MNMKTQNMIIAENHHTNISFNAILKARNAAKKQAKDYSDSRVVIEKYKNFSSIQRGLTILSHAYDRYYIRNQFSIETIGKIGYYTRKTFYFSGLKTTFDIKRNCWIREDGEKLLFCEETGRPISF